MPPNDDAPEELDDFVDDDHDNRTSRRKSSRAKSSGKSNSNTSLVLIILACVGLVSVCFCIPVLLALLLPAVQSARDAARSTQAMNHMKQLALAAHNFHDNYRHFPPNGVSLPGGEQTPLESNTVPQAFFTDILVYMDQALLYEQIQRGQSWSDPVNKGPFSTVIPYYLHPSISGSPLNGQGYAVAHFATNSKLISDTQTYRITDITDGTSNTIMLGSLNDGFKAWGDPTNHRDPSSGFAGGPTSFGATNRRSALILLCDGSVRRVNVDLAPDICARLADPADGQPVGDF